MSDGSKPTGHHGYSEAGALNILAGLLLGEDHEKLMRNVRLYAPAVRRRYWRAAAQAMFAAASDGLGNPEFQASFWRAFEKARSMLSEADFNDDERDRLALASVFEAVVIGTTLAMEAKRRDQQRPGE